MSSLPHDRRHEELLPAYVAGALDAEERGEIERVLEECAPCRAELFAWQETARALAESAPPVAPPPALREELLRRVEGAAPRAFPAPGGAAPEAPASRVVTVHPGAGRGLGFAIAASILFAIALGAFAWALGERGRLRTDLAQAEGQAEELAARVAAADGELQRTRAELASSTQMLAMIAASPPERELRLAGMGPATQGSGRLFRHPERPGAMFVAGNLPRLPDDRTYQLWTIAGGTPRSAGTFEVDAEGNGMLMVAEAPDAPIDAWAVTIEPAGGMPQPTGEMVLLS